MTTEGINSSKAELIRQGERLVEAAATGNHRELLHLLRLGVSVDAEEYNKSLFYASQNYVTPLQKACELDRLTCVKSLIAYGADVNARDRFDVTALHMAAQNGHYQCLKALLDAGADCSVPTKYSKEGCYTATPHPGGTTPLHLAAANNNIRCVRELILSGADYNAIDEKGRTSLYIAAQSKYEECVLIQLRSAVGRDILSLPGFETGDTPLHFAVRNGMVDSVKALLKMGSDPNHLNHAGMSPLHDAVSHNPCTEDTCEEIIRLLVLHGHKTDVNLRDGAGFTPLHYVSFSTGSCLVRRPKLAHFLLAYGANPEIENTGGYTLIENEIKYHAGDHSIMRTVLQTFLHPPPIKLVKLLLPNDPTPPFPYSPFHVIEEMIQEEREPDLMVDRFYRNTVKGKCLWYTSLSSQPRTLQHICRYHIRKFLGYKSLRHIKDLPLPFKLQQYLLFEGKNEYILS